jgi:hypothetical protein
VPAAPARTAAQWRGAGTGLLTAALALAAHGAAGAALPPGPAAVQLAVLAAVVGALAAALPGVAGVRGLVTLLAAGQLAAHLLLAAAGHVHGHPAGSATAMLTAHAGAVVAGAVLLAAGERLCLLLSSSVRAATSTPRAPLPAPAVPVRRIGPAPSRAMPALVSSRSHRGPPGP